MPRGTKVCGHCGTITGPRAYNCPDCGHGFVIKGRREKDINKNNINITINNTNNNGKVIHSHTPIDLSHVKPREVADDLAVNLDPSGFFDHLYEREAQLDILLGGVQTALQTDFKIRSHYLMHGPAAGGKTSFTDAFINMVGEEYCYKIDATTSTQAGILTDLTEGGSSPNFLVIDELEKCDPVCLRWLLGVMDERGEIRIINSKVGLIHKKLPAFVIATTNNIQKVQSFMSGALASRFSDHVYCPRISDSSIVKAMKRYVDMVDGDERWIEPAIKYVREVEGVDDLRRIKSVILGGRDRLLTGDYQKMLASVSQN